MKSLMMKQFSAITASATLVLAIGAVAFAADQQKASPSQTGTRGKVILASATVETTRKVEYVSLASFDQTVLKSDVPVLVDFYADWCGPCRALSPTLTELAREMPDAKIVKVNIDRDRNLASRYKVTAIPSLRVFKKEVRPRYEVLHGA